MIRIFLKIASRLNKLDFWIKPKTHRILILNKQGSDELFLSGIIKEQETYCRF